MHALLYCRMVQYGHLHRSVRGIVNISLQGKKGAISKIKVLGRNGAGIIPYFSE